jgi:hypothetical protein
VMTCSSQIRNMWKWQDTKTPVTLCCWKSTKLAQFQRQSKRELYLSLILRTAFPNRWQSKSRLQL